MSLPRRMEEKLWGGADAEATARWADGAPDEVAD